MFKWLKRLINKTVSSYDPVKPKKEVISLKDLKKKSKKQLESICRRMGIELDRRLTKEKLVNKIKFRAKLKRKK